MAACSVCGGRGCLFCSAGVVASVPVAPGGSLAFFGRAAGVVASAPSGRVVVAGPGLLASACARSARRLALAGASPSVVRAARLLALRAAAREEGGL